MSGKQQVFAFWWYMFSYGFTYNVLENWTVVRDVVLTVILGLEVSSVHSVDIKIILMNKNVEFDSTFCYFALAECKTSWCFNLNGCTNQIALLRNWIHYYGTL